MHPMELRSIVSRRVALGVITCTRGISPEQSSRHRPTAYHNKWRQWKFPFRAFPHCHNSVCTRNTQLPIKPTPPAATVGRPFVPLASAPNKPFPCAPTHRPTCVHATMQPRKRPTVHEDYFSIDAILAGEPRVYTVLRVDGHTLRHLDPHADASALSTEETTNSEDLPAGHRLALPFWLAESLVERSVADVMLPKCYSGGTSAALRSDASSVSLRTLCPRYFSLGVALSRLLNVRGLIQLLLKARAIRAWRAVDAGAHGCAKVLQILDMDEVCSFFDARASTVARARWKERRTSRIAAAPAALAARRSLLGKRPLAAVSPVTPAQNRARVR